MYTNIILLPKSSNDRLCQIKSMNMGSFSYVSESKNDFSENSFNYHLESSIFKGFSVDRILLTTKQPNNVN